MLNKCLSGKRGYSLGFVASFGLVALALWIQTRYQLNPCPLCISQRMVFMGLGLLFLVGALMPAKAIWQKSVTALLVLTALGGAGVALRHWWLQAHRDSIIA
jgi:disulfide bond formation protein DsbB